MVNKPVFAIVAILVFATGVARAAVEVRIDRDAIAESDSVRVTFVVDRSTPAPDFEPLQQDFEVLATYQSTSVNIVNGRAQQEVSWTVDLMPRRTGELTVPPIEFGGEMSKARTITVTAAPVGSDAPGEEIFLEIEASPDQPYVQAQTNLTVRVFRAVPMSSASLTEPNLSVGDAVIERLGDDVGYETTRGGQRYNVIERRYVLFPQQSGRLVIDPLVLEGRIGRRTSFFDSLDRGRSVRVRSTPLELEVRPRPAEFAGGAWLPAEDVLLTEDWPGQDDEWRAGEPLTRTLTLRARGLMASQLPEIGMTVPGELRQYPDQPQLDTRTVDRTSLASRRETVALIPGQAGEFTLPAIEIPWWNTRSDRPEVARLPARTVRALPAADPSPAGEPDPGTPPSVPAEEAAGDGPGAEGLPPASADSGWWPGLTALLALMWLVTLAAWWHGRRRSDVASAARPTFSAGALRRACAAGDPAAAQAELLRWAGENWPGDRIRSPGELAARLDGPLQHEVHRLSRARYGGAALRWDGNALWEAFRGWRRSRRPEASAGAPQLEPLYRS